MLMIQGSVKSEKENVGCRIYKLEGGRDMGMGEMRGHGGRLIKIKNFDFLKTHIELSCVINQLKDIINKEV